jgi:signal transduction histidine kinase
VRALLAWIAATFTPPRHTLTDAARALGATTPEQARTVARSIHRAAARVGLTLPTYPAGCPRGSAAWERMVATRAARVGAPRARKRSPAEMDAARRAHDAGVRQRAEERRKIARRKQREF